jgi:biopolymer transport protein ExbB
MEWFEKGGVCMWPLLVESVAALYFIIERIVFFSLTLPGYKAMLAEACKSEKVRTGMIKPDESDPLVKELLTAGNEKVLHLESLSLAVDKHLENAQHNLTALNIIAQTAPLFGLLGTVTGMIQAFLKIQNLQGQVNPSDLAGGIWEALITTAAGLTIAIPALIAYMLFASRIAKYETWLMSAIAHVEKTFRRLGWEVF